MLVLVLAVVLALCHTVVGDSCGNITITSTNTTQLETCSSHELTSLTITTTGAVSISSIQKITNSLTLSNTAVTDLVLPDLQSVGALRITDNADLRNVSLPQLQSVGDENGDAGELRIKGNSALTSVDMRNLEDVYGEFTLNGGFTLAISSLQKVTGAASITGAKLTCGLFDRLAADGDFSGSYTCSNNHAKRLSAGAKAGIAIGVILTILLVGLGVWFWIRRRGHPGPDTEASGDEEKRFSGYTPVPVPDPAPSPRTDAGSGLKIPRKPFPSQHAETSARPVDMLDGNSIYEAAAGVRSPVVYELDAGPQSRHQIPMNHE